jgi:Fe-S-cluster-containing dehydrogenase component/formate-dependent nitrite reductase membrane component NrfD
MKYGFVIDQRKCIGCHACTVACKAEHDMPIGVYRTWVKYIEKGEFPNTRRHFLVTRCNHCDDAPCVAICPTKALFTRADGIVDFDRDRCIGCKSCMQACPYDALHIDPETHTAAKCNYCAHRVDQGLQPACVIVCPEQAIIAGDLEDPASEIARLVGRESVRVRRPEQGTKPKVYYIGADEHAISPEASDGGQADLYMFLRPARLTGSGTVAPLAPAPAANRALEVKRAASATAMTLGVSPAEAEAMERHARGGDGRDGHEREVSLGSVRVGYDIPKARPWGWMVSAYLATKSAAAGVTLVAALAIALGLARIQTVSAVEIPVRVTAPHTLFTLVAPLVALLFLGATVFFLVADLKRPERFWYLLVKPNPISWLVWGGWILQLYGVLLVAWLGGELLGWTALAGALLWPAVALAIGAAGYTAFLFGQAEGRDFWQSPLLLPHLVAQAALAGAGLLALLGLALALPAAVATFLAVVLLVALGVHAAFVASELFVPHSNAHVRAAARVLVSGALARVFWLLVVGVGLVVAGIAALLALTTGSSLALAVAAVAALVGVVAFEHCYVVAGQSVPIS